VERIFTDILRACAPEQLTVYARYTRRGGLDINPWRSNAEQAPLDNTRTATVRHTSASRPLLPLAYNDGFCVIMATDATARKNHALE
jgi:hypothetical protein